MTKRVAEAVSCVCGYRGPTVTIAGQSVCPICRAAAAPAAPLGLPSAPPTIGLPAEPRVAGGTPDQKPKTHRIPCPRGHVLTAKPHMLGQQVVCPECNEIFTLREEDSLEQRKKREKARHADEERIARLWLTRSIWAAAFIVASLVGMIVFSFAFRAPAPPPAEQPTEPDPAARSE